jgi:hypothetical protein
MDDSDGISWQGILMIVIGIWLVLRSVSTDNSGRTLVNHILGTQSGNSSDPLDALLLIGGGSTALKLINPGGTPGGGKSGSGDGEETPAEPAPESPLQELENAVPEAE